MSRPKQIRASIGFLCFLWIFIWMLNSCFSSMLSSPMLMIPTLAAVVAALFLHPPRRAELAGSLMISLSLCLLLFSLGIRLAKSDSAAISRDNSGIVTITNNKIKVGRTCVIYVDQQALGEEFGKELRKFLLGADFARCVVIDRAWNYNAPVIHALRPEMVVLSGNTVGHVEILEGATKYILLNPAYLPGCLPDNPIQAIVWPEVRRGRYFEPDAALPEKFQSKIRVVPFDENFEISWSEYINL